MKLIHPQTGEDWSDRCDWQRTGKYDTICKDDSEFLCFNCEEKTNFFILVGDGVPVCSEECNKAFWDEYEKQVGEESNESSV